MFKRNLAGIVVMAGFIGLTQLPKAVQSVDAQSHEAAPGPAPTTAWGDPDLEGIWTRDSEEPLQRPTNFTDKEFFTDEERADLDRRRAEIIARDASRSAGRPMAGARPSRTSVAPTTLRSTHRICASAGARR